MAERHHVASSDQKYLEKNPFVSPWESEKNRSWSMPVEGSRITPPMSSVGNLDHVDCVWVVSGAA